MTFKQSQRYIDRLQEFARNYNKKYHRTIDTKPELVNPNNEKEVRVYTFLSGEEIPRKQTKRPYKFKVCDKVRISKIAPVFDREYDEKWSGEIFVVRRRFSEKCTLSVTTMTKRSQEHSINRNCKE